MNVDDAIYAGVHDYPGGCPALAPRFGLSPATLQNMADPRQQSHGWTLKKFRQLLGFTGDKRPLYALCEENGGIFVPISDLAAKGMPEIMSSIAQLAADLGAVAQETTEAVSDGSITPNERDRIEARLFELIQHAAALGQRVQLEAKPKHLKAVP